MSHLPRQPQAGLHAPLLGSPTRGRTLSGPGLPGCGDGELAPAVSPECLTGRQHCSHPSLCLLNLPYGEPHVAQSRVLTREMPMAAPLPCPQCPALSGSHQGQWPCSARDSRNKFWVCCSVSPAGHGLQLGPRSFLCHRRGSRVVDRREPAVRSLRFPHLPPKVGLRRARHIPRMTAKRRPMARAHRPVFPNM